jgi:hypothetical protein
MTKQHSAQTVHPGTASHLADRAELLAQLAFSRLGTVHLHHASRDWGYDFVIVTPRGATLLVVVKAFSSISMRMRDVETIRELRWQMDAKTLRWASTSPAAVVLFLIDGDTEHGRFLLVNDIPLRTSSGHRQTITFPIENTIDARGIEGLIAKVERRSCPMVESRDAQQSLPPRGRADRAAFYAGLINGGETETVEFKSTLRFDFETRSLNKELAKAVAKTLCGFMNASGGYLFIGVGDEGQPVGIDEDIKLLTKKTLDGFLSAFHQVVSDLIGKEFTRFVHPEIAHYKGTNVCCVRVEPSSQPAWLSDAGRAALFIRVGKSSRPLDPKDANDYVMSRFAGK